MLSVASTIKFIDMIAAPDEFIVDVVAPKLSIDAVVYKSIVAMRSNCLDYAAVVNSTLKNSLQRNLWWNRARSRFRRSCLG
jgi:hypothetical protein